MTPADRRTAIIDGLLDLAAFLEANPAVPAPYTVHAHHFPDRGPDEEIRAEIDKIATHLGVEVSIPEHGHGHYEASVTFGPIEYAAVGVLADARARYAADHSYAGCITPTEGDHR